MKNMDYKLLASCYYENKEKYDELYKNRINAPECMHLDFMIEGFPAFFIETPELMKKIIKILRLDKRVCDISKQLPKIALRQYINKCLVDEIVITNNIEGVHSTRKEIGEILDDLEGKTENRFYGLVAKYAALVSLKGLQLDNSYDIRVLYDEMFLKEVVCENPKNEPDGKIFRNGPVDIVNAAQKVVHHGLYPEDKIIQATDDAIRILKNDSIEPLFRIAVFHYLFGYIHPFYDGNGRMNRFITSYYLSSIFESIVAYRLSYTIKDNINKYYKGFKIVNDKKNKGDITPFIFIYLDFIEESLFNLEESLKEKTKDLELYSGLLQKFFISCNEKHQELYYYLLQASLFSEIGISTKDLLKNIHVSRPTLQKQLNRIEAQNLLISKKRANNKFYQLDLDRLIQMSGSH